MEAAGYLSEMLWPKEELIISEASRKLAAGNIKLDPLVKARGKPIKRGEFGATSI